MSDVERSDERPEPKLVTKMRERREEFRERGMLYRYVYVVAGFTILVAGLAMLVLPGPAFVVIPIGLAILSLEFVWAERLLDTALDRAAAAQHKASQTSPRQRLLTGVAVALGVAAFVVCAILYDIPVLPVV